MPIFFAIFFAVFLLIFSPFVSAKSNNLNLDLNLDFLKNSSNQQNINKNNAESIDNVLPELGDVASTELPVYQEREIGFQVLQSIRSDPSFLDDIFVLNYLNNIGKSLKRHIKNSEFNLTLFAIRDSSINAFALPGGYIGVHSGLILLADNESELAGVLAHEISHIEQRHISRKIYQSKKMSIPAMIAMGVAMAAAAASDNGGNVASAAISTSQAALMHNELAFSREFEHEADRFGFDLLRKSNFDAHGLADFFGRLYETNKTNEVNAISYLQTHPLTLQRLSDMQNREKVLDKTNSNLQKSTPNLNFYFVRAYLEFLHLRRNHNTQQLLNQISTRNPKNFLENIAKNYELALIYFSDGDKNNAKVYLENCQKEVEQFTHKSWKNFTFLVDLQANLENSPNIYEELIYKNKNSQAANFSEMVILYANFLLHNQNLNLNLNTLQNLNLLLDKQIALRSNAQRLKNLQNLHNLNKNFDFNLHYMYRLKAELSAVLKDFVNQNFYLANALILEGKFQAALTQLEIIKNQKNISTDFYLLSQVEAKISQLKTYLKNNPQSTENLGE